MITTDSPDVIQGDEQSRDRHYRAKQDLREHAANITNLLLTIVWRTTGP